MRRYVAAVAAIMAAGTALIGSASAGAAPKTAAAGSQAAPGTQLWAARFRGSGSELVSAMVVGPGGQNVFVAGESYGGRATGDVFKTVAYRASTGRRLWASRYSGPAKGAGPFAMAVSPGGRRVFVTGYSNGGRATGADYATVAYSATTGKRLWVSRYNGPASSFDGASAIAVSPGGAAVFVTGTSTGRGTGQSDYATVAYSAATGRRLWVSRYNGPANGLDGASAVAVSPDGSAVFVTGTSDGQTPGQYATVAYSAANGTQLWVSRYHGPGKSDGGASAVAVSPGGGSVFVTGISNGRTTASDYATVAYNAASGRQLWVRRYNGPANRSDGATSAAVSPNGTTVFVTGFSDGSRLIDDHYATVAYNSATGRQLWVSRYRGYQAESLAVSPGGAAVYVTGYNGVGGDYATVAYRTASGRQLWASRYHGPKNNGGAHSVAVSPSGSMVFVSGWSQGLTSYDYATIAYRS